MSEDNNDIKYVDTEKQTVYFCGKPRRIRNTKMKKIEAVNKNLEKLQKTNKKIDNNIMVLNNKLKETTDKEEYESIENEIDELEEKKITDEELSKASGELAVLLIEDFTTDEYIDEREAQDSELIFALLNIIKMIMVRTPEVKINNYVQKFIAASMEAQVNRIANPIS